MLKIPANASFAAAFEKLHVGALAFAKDWEKRNQRRYIAFSSGGGAMDAVHRQVMIMELAAHRGSSAGAVLVDMREYYEHIDRGLT